MKRGISGIIASLCPSNDFMTCPTSHVPSYPWRCYVQAGWEGRNLKTFKWVSKLNTSMSGGSPRNWLPCPGNGLESDTERQPKRKRNTSGSKSKLKGRDSTPPSSLGDSPWTLQKFRAINILEQGSPTPEPQNGIGPRPVRNRASQQEMSSGQAGKPAKLHLY